jgi:predicted  nucleic acid-binding Zn-ribbon protein
MSGRVESIFALQNLDAKIEEKRGALSSAEERLSQNEALVAARESVGQIEETVRSSRAELRELELDVEDLESKISSTEDALYGGEVSNPKELASMQQELDYLRRRQGNAEEEALSLMARVEEHESALESAERRLADEQQRWDQLQLELGGEAQELRSELETLEAQRDRRAASLPQSDLSLYQSLRRQKSGEAVALLEKGICQGCRVALPTSMVQKVRRGDELVRCSSCQRILYSPH